MLPKLLEVSYASTMGSRRELRHAYFAATSFIDAQVGRLVCLVCHTQPASRACLARWMIPDMSVAARSARPPSTRRWGACWTRSRAKGTKTTRWWHSGRTTATTWATPTRGAKRQTLKRPHGTRYYGASPAKRQRPRVRLSPESACVNQRGAVECVCLLVLSNVYHARSAQCCCSDAMPRPPAVAPRMPRMPRMPHPACFPCMLGALADPCHVCCCSIGSIGSIGSICSICSIC